MIPIEVRLRSGELDEIVGEGYYHLEQMSPTHWWLALGELHVNLFIEDGVIRGEWADEGDLPVTVVEQENT